MPEPAEYETEAEWMAACVPIRTGEGEKQEQAVAVCLSMWRGRNDKAAPMPQGFEYALDTNLTDWKQGYYTNKAADTNALKAISRTSDELRVGNYIILFGNSERRDLEGVASDRVNPDGSRGEFFTPQTDLSSFYTKAGVLYEDWEHAQGEAGDEDLGFVDWKTARIDDKGAFVERVLNRKNRYVRWLDELGWFDNGMLGTSSEAVPDEVEKRANGEIVRWPLRRDTITVSPMEPRMITENHLQAFKALGIPVPNDTEATPEPEPEASPEADAAIEQRAAVDVATVKARLLQIRLSLLEE